APVPRCASRRYPDAEGRAEGCRPRCRRPILRRRQRRSSPRSQSGTIAYRAGHVCTYRCIRTTAAVSDQVSAATTVPPYLTVSETIQGVHVDETKQATHAKDEFFSAGMYVFHVTGFPPPPDVLTRKAEAPPGARLDVWRTDPASDRHIPGPGTEGVAF